MGNLRDRYTEEELKAKMSKGNQELSDLRECIFNLDVKEQEGMIGNIDTEQGVKESKNKLHYEVSWEFIEEMAKRMANNKSDKYPLYNWKKTINVQELKDAINRHHIEVMKGNYRDEDEELGHVVSYACNAMMLWWQLANKTNIKND